MRNTRTLRPLFSSVTLFFSITICFAADTKTARDPGATRLAAELHNKGWIAYSAMSERGDWDLFLMRPDGSSRRNITNTPDTHELGARFSPDGRRILFRSVPKATKFTHANWGVLGKLIVAKSDGTNPHPVGNDGEFPWASWSPDGSQIACLTKGGIEIWDLASHKLVRKLDRKGIYQQLFWSPDGRWFTGPANTYGENWTVVRMDAATGTVNPVSKFQNCTADWFPDSKRLIYSSRPANQSDEGSLSQASGQKPDYGWTQLWMANGDGSGRQLIYGEDGRHVYGGDISPDSRYVLFTTASKDGGLLDSFIYVMRLSDAPTIGGQSSALRRLNPGAKAGVILPLTLGFEPHWTHAQIPGPK